MTGDSTQNIRIGDVNVKPTAGLSAIERKIEEKYLDDIKANLAEYIYRYRSRFGN